MSPQPSRFHCIQGPLIKDDYDDVTTLPAGLRVFAKAVRLEVFARWHGWRVDRNDDAIRRHREALAGAAQEAARMRRALP